MLLTVTASGPLQPLTELWATALAPMRIEHPNRISRVLVRIIDAVHPLLTVSLDRIPDNDAPERIKERFQISTVTLRFFPGAEAARLWLACAFAGYVMHEALELSTVDGARPADPHAGVYETNPFNRSLRDGFPVQLTPETLAATLRVVTG